MSTTRTAPGRWILFTDRGHAVAVMPAGQPHDICVLDHMQPEFDANAAFIVLADHHFDKLEAALRIFLTVEQDFMDEMELDESGIDNGITRAMKDARAIIAAIDAERSNP